MPIFNVLLPGQTPTHWDRTVCTFKAPTAPTTDLVRYFLETLYPNLSDVPYALSAFDDDGHLKSTPLQSFENVSIFTSLHSVEDVQKPPELGNPVLPDRRMNKNVSGKNTGSRLGSRSGSRTARKRSATSSPGETHTEDLDSLALSSRLEQLRDEEEPLSVNAMQSKLRTACMVRDRACVISRKVDLDACDAAHILTPEYSYQFFDNARIAQQCLAGVPNAGRMGRSYDVRNAVMMVRSAHSLFDDFVFSIYVKDGKVRGDHMQAGRIAKYEFNNDMCFLAVDGFQTLRVIPTNNQWAAF